MLDSIYTISLITNYTSLLVLAARNTRDKSQANQWWADGVLSHAFYTLTSLFQLFNHYFTFTLNHFWDKESYEYFLKSEMSVVGEEDGDGCGEG